jgi:hypothetical protein
MAKIFYLDRPGTVIGDGISKEEFEGMTVDQLREAVIRGGCSIFRRHDGSYDMADDRSDTPYDPPHMPDEYFEDGRMKLDPHYHEGGPSDEARCLVTRAIVMEDLYSKVDAILKVHPGAEHRKRLEYTIREALKPAVESFKRDAAPTS